MVELRKNRVLFDWVTVSFKALSAGFAKFQLGLSGLTWKSCRGSKLRYYGREQSGGITLHDTPDSAFLDESGKAYTDGCCLEMSGQGCREYETYSNMGIGDLLAWSLAAGGHITRLDLAYDDFQGVIDLERVAAQARRLDFTSSAEKLQITETVDKHDLSRMGRSVCHGSKSSMQFLRIYDKRAERQAWELPHWVRAEVQLRADYAHTAAERIVAGESIGVLYAGIVRQFVQYRTPDLSSIDSNVSRWPLSPWYLRWLGAVDKVKLYSPEDVEYNRLRLDAHIYERNHNALLAEIMADGVERFIDKVVDAYKPGKMPDKYKHVVPAVRDLEQIPHDVLRDFIKNGYTPGIF